MKHPFIGRFLLLACISCGAATEPESTQLPRQLPPPAASTDTSATPIAATEAPATPPLPASAVVTTKAALPASLAIDGAITEWGKLEGPADKQGKRDPADVVFVLTQESLTIAGRVTNGAAGVTVRFDFGAGELPTLGSPLRGGGVAELNCETTWDHQEMSEAEKAACRPMLDKAEAFRTGWRQDFRRDWQIGPSGVKVGGAPVQGAKAAFTAADGNGTFEVQIPIAALPLANESPVSGARAFVLPSSTWREPVFEDLREVGFSPEVSFGKLTEVRKAALQAWNASILEGAPAVGYRLGDDTSWRIAHRTQGGLAYVEEDVPLFKPRGKHKRFDVVMLFAGINRLATLDGAKVVGMETFSGEMMGTAKRKPGLHLFAYDEYPDEMGNTSARWTVYTVSDEGEVTSQGVDTPVYAWSKVEEFHDGAMNSFGLKGTALGYGEKGTPGVRVKYKYDKDMGWYAMSVSGLP